MDTQQWAHAEKYSPQDKVWPTAGNTKSYLWEQWVDIVGSKSEDNEVKRHTSLVWWPWKWKLKKEIHCVPNRPTSTSTACMQWYWLSLTNSMSVHNNRTHRDCRPRWFSLTGSKKEILHCSIIQRPNRHRKMKTAWIFVDHIDLCIEQGQIATKRRCIQGGGGCREPMSYFSGSYEWALTFVDQIW